MGLQPDELLFVEGAEDFDVVAPDAAVTTQVKNAGQPVSLRSKDVQDAIRHYWELRTAHVGTQISLRFLTRGTIVQEQGAPFGHGVAGLGLWMRPTITDAQCKALADFLISLDRVGQDLIQWLQVASSAQILQELIGAITWETSAEAVEYVERAVNRRLAAIGETRGVPPSTTTRIARRLFDEIWKILRKKIDRFVDRLRLEELWEEETHVIIPHAEYQNLLRELATRTLGGHGFAELFQRGAPPLAGIVAQRSTLVDQIQEHLSADALVDLYGSTRMGKTTLAKLVVRRDAAQWLWWSAARLPGRDIARALRILTRELDAQPAWISVVLDDPDFTPTTVCEFEEALGELIATIRGRRGSLLITSHKPLSAGLRHAFDVSADQIIAVPKLCQEEVAEIATGLGCPDEHREKWAAIVHAVTAGHPHLAAVHLLTLQRNMWPSPTIGTLSAVTAEVDAEKNEARQLLNSLPLGQRQALYRLSVFPGVFRRDHAITIISSPPPLPEPGDLFDPLLGPWIEPLHAGYFALSPLISGCAKQVFSAPEIRKLQADALQVLYECEPRTLIAGSSAFRLAWELQDASELVRFAIDWASMDEDNRAAWAEYLAWFIFEGHRTGEDLLPDNPMVSFLLRKYQFDLAIKARPERAILVYRSWRREAASRPLSAVERVMISTSVLPYNEMPLSGNEVVALLGELAVAMADNPNLASQLPARPDLPEFSYLSGVDDTVSTCGLFVCWRCKTIQFLNELLDSLGAAPPELRTRILKGFASNEGHLRLAISRTWMAEAECETPDWSRCVSVFQKAYRLGLAWGFKELALAAISGIAVVQDEYLHDSATAHATIDQLANEAGLDSHQIDDRRANIYFSEEKFTEAEAYWHRSLSRWPAPTSPADQSAAFAARSAGVAAAKMGKWEAASAWFAQVQRWLPEPKDKPFLARALADAAYAHWKAGNPKVAVIAAIDAWEVADSLPAGKKDLRIFATQKGVGHVVAWLHGSITEIGVGNIHEPTAGMCSNPAISEQIRELEPTESAGVWIFLMRMERKCGAAGKAAKVGIARVKTSRSIIIRPLVVLEMITQGLLSGEVTDLPQKCVEFTTASWDAARANPNLPNKILLGKQPEKFHREDELIGASLFLAGITSAAAIGTPIVTLLSSWRASVVTNPFSKDWNDWFDEIERLLAAPPSSAMAIVWPGTSSKESIVLGVLNIIFAQSSSPEDLFAAHARFLQVASGSPSPWFREIGEAICGLVARAWMRTTESPALLRQPRFSIPEIRAACSAAGSGLQKAVRILLAARNAVTTRLGVQLQAYIEKLGQ